MNPHQANKVIDLILEIKDEVSAVKGMVKENTVVLNEHERRSTASEQRLDLLEARNEDLTRRIYLYDSVFKVLVGAASFIATVLGIIYTIQSIQ